LYTQAVLKSLKLNTEAQQREAVVQGRSLSPYRLRYTVHQSPNRPPFPNERTGILLPLKLLSIDRPKVVSGFGTPPQFFRVKKGIYKFGVLREISEVLRFRNWSYTVAGGAICFALEQLPYVGVFSFGNFKTA
jgi:hypothetical protein